MSLVKGKWSEQEEKSRALRLKCRKIRARRREAWKWKFDRGTLQPWCSEHSAQNVPLGQILDPLLRPQILASSGLPKGQYILQNKPRTKPKNEGKTSTPTKIFLSSVELNDSQLQSFAVQTVILTQKFVNCRRDEDFRVKLWTKEETTAAI